MLFIRALKLILSGTKVSPLIDLGKKVYIKMFKKPPLAIGLAIFEGSINAIANCVKEIAIYISYLI
jgi:hypothetical protein